MNKRKIAILGSTGSIGRQALDVVRKHKELFDIELLTANSNYSLLAQQAIEFDVNNVVICQDEYYLPLKDLLNNSFVKVFSGIDSVCALVQADDIDIVLTAMVGFSGLKPTLSAINAGKIIALANKETLVAGGEIVMGLAQKNNTCILPVDSEHSAIFQCLMGNNSLIGNKANKISKLHLTASGGPFRTLSKAQIAKATKTDALKHPQWNMGNKITIDSATLMNKGFEMIEAKWLFDISPKNINIVVHPQSVIHSMIEFEDGAVLSQMGMPDMRQPISYALSFPYRLAIDNEKLNFTTLKSLTFEAPSYNKFPCLNLAFQAIDKGGNIPCAMNAANEAVVDAYLHDKIRFYDMPDIINKVMSQIKYIQQPNIDDIFNTNNEAFILANKLIYNL